MVILNGPTKTSTRRSTKRSARRIHSTRKAKIVGETAKAPWKELERFYAQGMLILVSNTLDLVEVGYTISIDDADQIRQWMEAGLLVKNFDPQAIAWEKDNTEVWTVVIRPWVLIQERK